MKILQQFSAYVQKHTKPRILKHSFSWVDSSAPSIEKLEKDIFQLVEQFPPKKQQIGKKVLTSPTTSVNARYLTLEYPNRGKWRKNVQDLVAKIPQLKEKYDGMILHEAENIPSRFLSFLKKFHTGDAKN